MLLCKQKHMATFGKKKKPKQPGTKRIQRLFAKKMSRKITNDDEFEF